MNVKVVAGFNDKLKGGKLGPISFPSAILIYWNLKFEINLKNRTFYVREKFWSALQERHLDR